MDIKIPKLRKDKLGYIVRNKYLNDLAVFNRPEDVNERKIYMQGQYTDKSVYLFIDKMQPGVIVLPFNVSLNYKPIYIGKGHWDPEKEDKARAVRHQNDLLSSILKADPKRYECIIFENGMTENEASCLEARWIQYLCESGFSLSTKHIIGDLINKRRELTWEKRCNQILRVENELTTEKIYC